MEIDKMFALMPCDLQEELGTALRWLPDAATGAKGIFVKVC